MGCIPIISTSTYLNKKILWKYLYDFIYFTLHKTIFFPHLKINKIKLYYCIKEATLKLIKLDTFIFNKLDKGNRLFIVLFF